MKCIAYNGGYKYQLKEEYTFADTGIKKFLVSMAGPEGPSQAYPLAVVRLPARSRPMKSVVIVAGGTLKISMITLLPTLPFMPVTRLKKLLCPSNDCLNFPPPVGTFLNSPPHLTEK